MFLSRQKSYFKRDKDVKNRRKPTLIVGAVVIAGQEVRVRSAHTGVIVANYTFQVRVCVVKLEVV